MRTATSYSKVASERRSVAARRVGQQLGYFFVAWLVAVGVLALPLQAERVVLSKDQAEAILKALNLPFPPGPNFPSESIDSGEFFALTEIEFGGRALKSGELFEKLKESWYSTERTRYGAMTGDSLTLRSSSGNGYRFLCSNITEIGKAEIAQGLGIYRNLTMERTADGSWARVWMSIKDNKVQFHRGAEAELVASCGSSAPGLDSSQRESVRLAASMGVPLRQHIARTCAFLSRIPFPDLWNALGRAGPVKAPAGAGAWIEAELVRSESGSWVSVTTAQPNR